MEYLTDFQKILKQNLFIVVPVVNPIAEAIAGLMVAGNFLLH